MSQLHTKRSVSKRRADRAPTHLREVLVAVDLSALSDRVLGRVALLPLAPEARVTLLHVVPEMTAEREQELAKRDARKALLDQARHLRSRIPGKVTIESVVNVGAAHQQIALAARAHEAELIVMGRGGGSLRDIVLGSTAERVIRKGQLPVLVVRLAPRARYQTPAVALDLDPTAHEVLRLALRVLAAPRPPITVIHAFDAPYRGMVYPSLPVIEAERRKAELRAQAADGLADLLARAFVGARPPSAEPPRWKPHLRFGSPRLVIQNAVEKIEADLLVLGTHGHAGVMHLLLGTVAGDVLREVRCDVLVVPPIRNRPGLRPPSAGGPAA